MNLMEKMMGRRSDLAPVACGDDVEEILRKEASEGGKTKGLFRSLVRKTAAGTKLSETERKTLASLLSAGVVTESHVRSATEIVRQFEKHLECAVDLVIKANAAKAFQVTALAEEERLKKALQEHRGKMSDAFYAVQAAGGAVGALSRIATEHPDLFEDMQVPELLEKHVRMAGESYAA